MTAHTLSVSTADGKTFDCYVSRPTQPKAPAILVIQEIFGINEWVRTTADWLSSSGFLAVAPDLFHRIEPGIQLSDRIDAQLQRAFQLYGQFDEDLGVDDLRSTLAAIRNMPECLGKVGSLGFCLGGKLAYLMATRSDADANVSYYGVGIEKNLDEASHLSKPLLMHIAAEDEHVDKQAQSQISAALSNHPLVEMHTYPNMHHAFARIGGANYDKTAAELSHSRSLEFLRRHLNQAEQ